MPEQTYDYLIAPKASFDATADAIRAKTGSQDSITWGQDGFADAIDDLIGGGIILNSNGVTIADEEDVLILGDNYNGEIIVCHTPILTNSWDFTTGLVDSVGSLTATLSNGATQDSFGLHITGSSQYCSLPVQYSAFKTYEIDVSSFSKSFSSGHGRFFMATNGEGLILNNGSSWQTYLSSNWSGSGGTDQTAFNGKTVKICTGRTRTQLLNGTSTIKSFWDIYIDGVLWFSSPNVEANQSSNLMIGSNGGASLCDLVITGFRVYDGVNYSVEVET